MELEEYLIIVGDKLKAIRKSKGLTQMDMVERIASPVSFQNISAIERGQNNISLGTLKKMCDALEVDVKDVLP